MGMEGEGGDREDIGQVFEVDSESGMEYEYMVREDLKKELRGRGEVRA